ncbi:MAG: response regulator transcription factor [Thermoanaerobaculia bacterium]|nr:response regulator transcription factor [Thermoanaerobaculia bacterium]
MSAPSSSEKLPPPDSGASAPARILAVDDDPEVGKIIRATLKKAGYETWIAASGEEALTLLAERGLPHLVIVDIMLPGLDGLALCQKIQEISDVPIMMLTVVDKQETVVNTIERFAEDYMIKPFNPRELTARVGRVLKRMGDFSYTLQPEVRVDQHLAVDFVRQRAIVDGRPLALTPTETKLLYILMRNGGKTVATPHILARLWPAGDADENTLRVHIHRLRQKIEISPSRPRYVVTERGAGYTFLAPPGA